MGDSFYNSPLADELVGCFTAILANAANVAVEIVGDEVLACLFSTTPNGFDFFENLYSLTDGSSISDNIGSMIWSLAKIVADCSTFIPGLNVYAVSVKAVRIILDIISNIALAEDLLALRRCTNYWFGIDDERLIREIRVITSFDPNEKVGSVNLNDQNFTQSERTFHYKIGSSVILVEGEK
ncbi:MAG: hypothetical protein AAF806_22025, partial [Bacteroidota bacterium]